MTFTELENALIAKGIRREALAINEIPIDGQYCIQFNGEVTEVFRFERGKKSSLATFRDTGAAMEHFRALVLADRAAYARWDPSLIFRHMTPDQLITDVSLRRFHPPLSEAQDCEKAALSDLGVLLLYLDFDAEVSSGGILGFIENPSGYFLNHTIEMFHRINATETEVVLRGIKSIMDKHGVATASLRADCAGNREYTISSFSQRHGTRLGAMAEEFASVPGKLYTEPDATEDGYALMKAFVADHFDSIVSQLERLLA